MVSQEERKEVQRQLNAFLDDPSTSADDVSNLTSSFTGKPVRQPKQLLWEQHEERIACAKCINQYMWVAVFFKDDDFTSGLWAAISV